MTKQKRPDTGGGIEAEGGREQYDNEDDGGDGMEEGCGLMEQKCH